MHTSLPEYQLGAPAAERDPLLAKCFVRSKTIQHALSFDNTQNILIGKKGSGKSAIFLIGRGPSSRIPAIRISPSSHRIDIQTTPLNYRQFADILEYELSLECLRTFQDKSSWIRKLSRRDRAELQAITTDYVEKIKSLGGRVTGLSAFGLGLNLAENQGNPLDVVTKQELQVIRNILKRLTEVGAQCLILIDDPEHLFAYEQAPPIDLLGALLFAATELTYRFRSSIKAVILLKLHLYQQLGRTFEDIDHLRQNFMMLKWSENDLEDLLRIRMAVGLDLRELSADKSALWLVLFGEKNTVVKASEVRNYILERLVSGPRDLIRFANQILTFQAQELNGWEAIRAAESTYSGEQLDQLNLQYGERGYSDITSVVLKLFDSDRLPGNGEADRDVFRRYFRTRLREEEIMKQRQKHAWLEALTWKTLGELLFEVGVLGYWSRRVDRYVLPYETISEKREFLSALRWRINPAFRSSLGIAYE